MSKARGFASLYKIQDHEWLDRCKDGTCKFITVKCRVCGHSGHITTHKKGSAIYDPKKPMRVNIVVTHGHFLGPHKGRNIHCLIGTHDLTPNDVVWSWRIDEVAEARILREYEDREDKTQG